MPLYAEIKKSNLVLLREESNDVIRAQALFVDDQIVMDYQRPPSEKQVKYFTNFCARAYERYKRLSRKVYFPIEPWYMYLPFDEERDRELEGIIKLAEVLPT